MRITCTEALKQIPALRTEVPSIFLEKSDFFRKIEGTSAQRVIITLLLEVFLDFSSFCEAANRFAALSQLSRGEKSRKTSGTRVSNK